MSKQVRSAEAQTLRDVRRDVAKVWLEGGIRKHLSAAPLEEIRFALTAGQPHLLVQRLCEMVGPTSEDPRARVSQRHIYLAGLLVLAASRQAFVDASDRKRPSEAFLWDEVFERLESWVQYGEWQAGDRSGEREGGIAISRQLCEGLKRDQHPVIRLSLVGVLVPGMELARLAGGMPQGVVDNLLKTRGVRHSHRQSEGGLTEDEAYLSDYLRKLLAEGEESENPAPGECDRG